MEGGGEAPGRYGPKTLALLAGLFCLAAAWIWMPYFTGDCWGPDGWGVFITAGYFSHIAHGVQQLGELPLFSAARFGETYLFHLNAENPLYAPYTLLFTVLSVEGFCKAFLAIHLLIGFLGLYRLCRRLGVDPWFVLPVSAVVLLSGFMAARVYHGHFMIVVFVWIPWVLESVLAILERPAARPALGLALALLMAFVSGGNHVVIWSGLIILMAAIWALVVRRSLAAPAALSLAVGLFLGLAAFKMLPALMEYGGYEPLLLHGYTPGELLHALTDATIPHYTGRQFPGDPHTVNWWELYAYVGYVPLAVLLLSVPAALMPRFRYPGMGLLLCMALAFLLLTMGTLVAPLHAMHFPGIMYERHTTRMIIIPILLLTVHAGLVLTRLAQGLSRRWLATGCVVLTLALCADFVVKDEQWMVYDLSDPRSTEFHHLPYAAIGALHDRLYAYDIRQVRGMEEGRVFDFEEHGDGVLVHVGRDAGIRPGQKPTVLFGTAGHGAAIRDAGSLFPRPALAVSTWFLALPDATGRMELLRLGGVDMGLDQGTAVVRLAGDRGVVRLEAPVAPGAPHHLVATTDGAAARLYVDGALAAEARGPGTLAAPSDEPAFLGGGPAAPFHGMIGPTKLYGQALDAAQAAALHAAGPQAKPLAGAGLLAAWDGGAAEYFRGLRFDGQDDYIEFANSPDLAALGQGPFSMAAWFCSRSRTQNVILSNAHIQSDVPSTLLVQLNTGNGEIRVALVRDKVVDEVLGHRTDLVDGMWHMAVVVFDGAGSLKIYVDGRLDNEAPLAAGVMPLTFTSPWRIGTDDQASPHYMFDGIIRSVGLWARALGPDEVGGAYAAGRDGELPESLGQGIRAWWDLGAQIDLPHVADATGYGHAGLAHGMGPDAVVEASVLRDRLGRHDARFDPGVADRVHRLVFRGILYDKVVSHLEIEGGHALNLDGTLAVDLPWDYAGPVRLRYVNGWYDLGKAVSAVAALAFLALAWRRSRADALLSRLPGA